MRTVHLLIIIFASVILINCSSNDDPTSPSNNNNSKYTVSGTVTDQHEMPVEGVKILANAQNNSENSDSTFTNADGKYTLNLQEGEDYSFFVTFSGTLFLDQLKSVSSLSRNETINFSITIAKQAKIYGTVSDTEGSPLEGIELKLVIDNDSSNATSTLTNSDGYYEYLLPPSNSYQNWGVSIQSQYRFDAYPLTGGLRLDEDLEINFEQLEDYERSWTATGDGLAESASEEADSSNLILRRATFDNTEPKIFWYDHGPGNFGISYEYTRAFNSVYLVEKSQSSDIHKISFPGADNAQYEGIFEVTKTGSDFTLKIEVVNVNESGNTPPTIEEGFGSSNGGENGMEYVWTFKNRS